MTDAVTTLNFLFLGGRAPQCFDAADADDDGAINITDPVATLNWLFVGAAPLPPPLDEPGVDPTPDGLTCLTREG